MKLANILYTLLFIVFIGYIIYFSDDYIEYIAIGIATLIGILEIKTRKDNA